MYVLDTNVSTELRKAKAGRADRSVTAWAQSVPTSSLFLSAITVLELQHGVLLVERRDADQGAMLRAWMTDNVLPAFHGRILPIDTRVALRCANLHVPNPCTERDALVAATALVHDMAVVTRDVTAFAPTGVDVLNPWAA